MAALRKASEFQTRIHSQWTLALQKKVGCSMFIVPCLTELFSRYQTKGKRSNRYENKSRSTEDRMLRPKVPMSRTIIKTWTVTRLRTILMLWTILKLWVTKRLRTIRMPPPDIQWQRWIILWIKPWPHLAIKAGRRIHYSFHLIGMLRWRPPWTMDHWIRLLFHLFQAKNPLQDQGLKHYPWRNYFPPNQLQHLWTNGVLVDQILVGWPWLMLSLEFRSGTPHHHQQRWKPSTSVGTIEHNQIQTFVSSRFQKF